MAAPDAVQAKTQSKKQESAKKQEETTNASMKGQEAASVDASNAEQAGGEVAAVGSTKAQVEALLNVYTEQATAEDHKLVNTIVNALKGAWNFLKSILNKNKDDGGTNNVPQATKEETLAKLMELFQTSDSLSEIANDAALMDRIMKEMPSVERNQALDAMYDEVTDKEILKDMIEVRFGVIVYDGTAESYEKLDSKAKSAIKGVENKATKDGSKDDNMPKDWSESGLHEVYKVYILLPQTDLDLIRCVAHRMDNSIGGAAMSETGVYWVNYDATNVQARETYDEKKGGVQWHIDSADDKRHDVIMMDMTTAHELGHIVDGRNGWKYSKNGSAMWNASKWEETPDNPETVVEEMSKSISGGPYQGVDLSAAEMKVVKKGAVLYLGRDQDTFAGKWNAAKEAMKEDLATAAESLGETSIDAEALGKKVAVNLKTNETSLLYHLWRGQAANSAHYHMDDAMKGMGRPFHQGYKNQPWYTFDYAGVWGDKISCYQYRCPKEEFAELYASYHTAPIYGKKKGEMTPSKLLNWFVAEGLGEAIPDGGSSGVEEETEHH